ncbi:hypothetical protein E2F50_15135 [Rhizobium deserti]|uniref:Uncharacterized protein n=1 Tax=Rhizobium deserti TaxID=2547961 RepID=A0A4R5UHV1_9HYPH|nr:hypothetical protein [Rhizobium deserti]TDK35561.1 hypothetical protein E2F50_15135 [Rhizobium deserti]
MLTLKLIRPALAFLLLCAPVSLAQQGGTLTPDTSSSQGVNSGGPLGSQAVERPTNAIPDSVKKGGEDCQKMANTVSGQRPATSGANEPQPQIKCEGK